MTKPYPFQEVGIAHITKHNGRALVADEMGLGKTLQSLVWAKRNKKISAPVIVVCPASLKWNWAEEAKQHINANSDILNGTVPYAHKLIRKRNLTIINYDILGPWMEYLLSLKAQTVILDECTYIKSPSTNRTKNIKTLVKNVRNLIGLTGTPLLSRPIEIWQLLNLLDKKKWKNRSAFGHRYCAAKRTKWGWDYRGADHLPELCDKLTETGMIRRLKADVLHDLPNKSRHIVLCHLSEAQEKEYKEASSDFITWLAKQDKTKAKQAKKAVVIARMGYLKRLIASFKYEAIVKWIDTFLQESTGKLIIFGIHKKVLEPLIEHYGEHAVFITGKVKGIKRQEAVHRFQNDPTCSLIFGNLAAMGVGLTLTASSTVLFTELGWAPGEHLQAEDRPHRIGQENHVQCFYLVAKNTMEVKLCNMLQDKQKVLTTAIDGGDAPDDLDIWSELIKEMRKPK